MIIKGLVDEEFVSYSRPSMYIAFPYCTFKCERECGIMCCQNSSLARSKDIDVNVDNLIKRYLGNPITKAIVLAGLEPLDSFDDVIEFLQLLRFRYSCADEVVIYTGYNEDEVEDKIEKLKIFSNVIVKFGRFVPDQKQHYDDVLGVNLYDPQYAVRL